MNTGALITKARS